MSTTDRPRQVEPDDLDRLLQELSTERLQETKLRERVLELSLPIIDRVIAESFSSSGYSRDQLFRPGYLGLLNAVYNYDLSRGKPFREYAENLIKGEIRQHIRDQTDTPKPPSWMQDLNRQVEQTQAQFLQESGYLPTLTELADTVNITEEGLSELFKARDAVSYVSLDAKQRRNDPTPQIDISKIRAKRPSVFPIEMRVRIAMALERLADLQQDLFRSLFTGE